MAFRLAFHIQNEEADSRVSELAPLALRPIKSQAKRSTGSISSVPGGLSIQCFDIKSQAIFKQDSQASKQNTKS